MEGPGEKNAKLGTVSWWDKVDNLPLPSRTFYNEKNNEEEIKKNEREIHNNNYNIHDRSDNLKEKGVQEELELEKIKSNRLHSELNRLKNIKETQNTRNLLRFINKISYNPLRLGKKIDQGGFSEIYE